MRPVTRNDEIELTLLPKKRYNNLQFTNSIVKQKGSLVWVEIYEDIALKEAHFGSKAYLSIQELMFGNIA